MSADAPPSDITTTTTQVSIGGTEIEFYEFDEAGRLAAKSKQSLQVGAACGHALQTVRRCCTGAAAARCVRSKPAGRLFDCQRHLKITITITIPGCAHAAIDCSNHSCDHLLYVCEPSALLLSTHHKRLSKPLQHRALTSCPSMTCW